MSKHEFTEKQRRASNSKMREISSQGSREKENKLFRRTAEDRRLWKRSLTKTVTGINTKILQIYICGRTFSVKRTKN